MAADGIDALRQRLQAARAELAGLPELGRGRQGDPDPETGESWDRGNVMAHMAEMLLFWTDQVRQLRAGAASFGRGEDGYAQRKLAIQDWAGREESQLRGEIDAGVADLLRLLDELAPGDLERRVTYRSLSGEREVEFRYPIEELLVGHLEAHVRQFRELG